MAKFISLMNYTAQGVASVKESPSRLDAAREGLSAMGVTIDTVYLTLGEYDLVAIVDAPDVETAAKALMVQGMQGNVSSTTMAALSEEEFRSAVADLP